MKKTRAAAQRPLPQNLERSAFYRFAHLSAKKQLALVAAKPGLRLRYSDAMDDKLRQEIVGQECPPLQRRLFDCLCDGNIWWIPAAFRRPIRVAGLTAWTHGLWPMAEYEVIEVVYRVEWDRLRVAEQRSFRRRLSVLQAALKARLMQRDSPFSLCRPASGYLWLQEPVGAAVMSKMLAMPDNKDSDEVPMSLEDCRQFLCEALSTGRRKVAELEGELRTRGCRPGTFHRAMKQLGVKRKREGFGGAGSWYVSL